MTAKARILKGRSNRTTCTQHDWQEPWPMVVVKNHGQWL